MLRANLFAFLCGALCEGLCTLWVLCVRDGHPWRSAGLSTVYAGVQVAGLTLAMRYGGVGWALGYGFGTFLAMKFRA